MIVPMRRVLVASPLRAQTATLQALAEAGVLHVEPADPAAARPDPAVSQALVLAEDALQRLTGLRPAGLPQPLPPAEVAALAVASGRRLDEHRHRMQTLRARLDTLGPWGGIRLAELAALAAAGWQVGLHQVPADQVERIQATGHLVLTHLRGGLLLVATLQKGTQPPLLPERSQTLPWPAFDRTAITEEMAIETQAVTADRDRLACLAHHLPALLSYREDLRRQVAFSCVDHSRWTDPDFLVLQGWVPSDGVDRLRQALASRQVPAAVTDRDPLPEEQPPTLVRYPRWAQPIAGLFRILGSVSGYREPEVGAVFLLSLPLFAALLISDWGYSCLLLALFLLARRSISAAMGRPLANLGLIIGAAGVVWGLMANSFFGFALLPGTLVTIDTEPANRAFFMRLAFTIALIHLLVAWGWQVLRTWPDRQAGEHLGWGLVVISMYGVTNYLVLGDAMPFGWANPYTWCMILGVVLALWFHAPRERLPLRLAYGLGNLPFNFLGKFSDLVSYIRLMAVGLAGSVLAAQFNAMALPDGRFTAMTPFILMLGHGLNFALCLIALFAHGVRLNMLEFSCNLGLQWAGHPYRPFTLAPPKED